MIRKQCFIASLLFLLLLSAAGQDGDSLPVHRSDPFLHQYFRNKDGSPGASIWNFINPDPDQPVRFVIRIEGDSGVIANPRLGFVGAGELDVPVTLNPGDSVVCSGASPLTVFRAGISRHQQVYTSMEIPLLYFGHNAVTFRCDYPAAYHPAVSVTYWTIGAGY